MKEILQLYYNTYRCESSLMRIDNKNIRHPVGDKINSYINKKRLQHYILPSKKGWKGLFDEIDTDLGDPPYTINFIGTRSDFNDLLSESGKYHADTSKPRFNLFYALNGSAEFRASSDWKRLQIDELLKNIKENNLESMSTADIQSNFESALNSHFKILFTAPVSGGKSTLQNAIVGREYLPTDNNAETAVTVEARLNAGYQDFSGTAVLDDTGETIKLPCPLTQNELTKLNSEKQKDNPDKALYRTFYIEAPCTTFHDIRVIPVFVDTPGGNNAMNQYHKKVLLDALASEDKGIICVVFTATDISTDDVMDELKMVANTMKYSEDGKLDEERFLFICNKSDQVNDFEKTRENLFTVLQSCGIRTPSLYFCCARAAELARMKQYINSLPAEKRKEANISLRKDPKKDQSDYGPYIKRYNIDIDDYDDSIIEPIHTYRYSSISKEEIAELDLKEQKLQEKLKEAQARQDKAEINRLRENIAIINSGITAIENAIRTYCSKYALPIKIQQFYFNIKRKAAEQNMLQNALDKASKTEKDRIEAHHAAIRQKEEYDKSKVLDVYLAKVDEVALDQNFIQQQEYKLELALSKIQPQNCKRLLDKPGLWCKTRDFDTYITAINKEINECMLKSAKCAIDHFNNDAINQMNTLLTEFQKRINSLAEKGVFDLNGLKIDQMSPFIWNSPDNIQAETTDKKEKTGETWIKEKGFMNWLRRANPFSETHSGFKKQDVYENISYTSVSEYLKNRCTAEKTAFHTALVKCEHEVSLHLAELKKDVKNRMRELDEFIQKQFDKWIQLTDDAEKLAEEAKKARNQAEALISVLKQIDCLLEINE